MGRIIVAIIGVIIGVFLFGLAWAALLSFPLMWCWNYSMTHAFGLPEIGWLHAFCLLFLAGLLIKSSSSASTKSD